MVETGYALTICIHRHEISKHVRKIQFVIDVLKLRLRLHVTQAFVPAQRNSSGMHGQIYQRGPVECPLGVSAKWSAKVQHLSRIAEIGKFTSI